MSKDYRTPEQFREIVDSMINGNWSQAARECVDYGFYAQDLLNALEADDNWEEGDTSLLPDLVLLAELAAEVRYKK